MSNELNNMIARSASGIFEGVAIGGDRFPKWKKKIDSRIED